MADTPDDSDLRERIAELEATVEKQQETITKMLPGRRSALKAGGLLAGGGLLGAAGSDQAAAADGTQDTSDGTVRGEGGGVDVRLDELRDPGGDEVFDVDDTGAINAAVSGREWRFDSINTKRVSYTAEQSGVTRILSDWQIDGENHSSDLIQYTESVSTSPKVILDGATEDAEVGFMLLISGEDTAAANDRFTDLVIYSRGGEATVIGNAETQTPSTRTYSVTDSVLELEMGADTYDVIVRGVGQRGT